MESGTANFQAAEDKRFRVKVGVFLVLFKDDALLCLRRYQTGIEDGLYVVPMGGLQEEETPLQAVAREAREEVNLTVKHKDLLLKHVMYRKHTQPDGYFFYQQDLFFVAHQFTGILRNLEPHKADDVRFININDLPKSLSPFVKQAIECILSDVPYSEFGFSENKGDEAISVFC
jgi:8-oxo-dGTP pyrophosphatase MutT (NUDIX family)